MDIFSHEKTMEVETKVAIFKLKYDERYPIERATRLRTSGCISFECFSLNLASQSLMWHLYQSSQNHHPHESCPQ